MKVLVTGGCGLIGFHVSQFYATHGHEVVVLDNLERSSLLGHRVSGLRKNFNRDALHRMGVSVVEQDVSSEEVWKNLGSIFSADYIFHLAGQCGVPTSIEDPRRDFEVNTIGTFNMLEYARKHGSRVVYASTNKVYPLHVGWTKDKETLRWKWEDPFFHANGFPVSPGMNHDYLSGSRTPYGTSKYAGDLLCQEYHHTYGVPTGVFRMSCIYGDHQFGFEEQGWATWFAIACMSSRDITIYGDGCQVRDMLWVDDLVEAYNAFMTSNLNHGVWNIGGGPKFTLSLNECLDMLEEIVGRRSPVTYDEWRPSDQRVYTSNINPLKNSLGWTPKVTPREGLERVVEWAKPIIHVF